MKTTKSFQVRLPQDLHERLVAISASNARSLNSEIMYRLFQSFEYDRKARFNQIAADLLFEELSKCQRKRSKTISLRDSSTQSSRKE